MLDNSPRQQPMLRITDSLSFKNKCQACHLLFRVWVRSSCARDGSAAPDGCKVAFACVNTIGLLSSATYIE